jgi:hypothetical protein
MCGSQAWFFGEGTELPVKMEYDTSLATQAYDLASKWEVSRDSPVSALPFKAEDLDQFNANQKSEAHRNLTLSRILIYSCNCSCFSRAAPLPVTVTPFTRASPYLLIFVQHVNQL